MDTPIVMRVLQVCELSAQGKLLGKGTKGGIQSTAPAKTIQSYSKFVFLANLDDKTRMELLDAVIDGQLSLEEAKHKSDYVKKVRWVRQVLLQYLKIDTWEQAVDKYQANYLEDSCDIYINTMNALKPKQINDGIRPHGWKDWIKELKKSRRKFAF